MKRIAVITVMLVLAGCASVPPRLNEPVTLLPGETKQIGPDGFELTLRSVAESSGCFSAADCSTMLFDGSLGVRLGDKTRLIQAGAVLRPGQALRLDIEGYEFDMTDIRRTAAGQLQATFLVRGRGKAR